MNPDSMMRGLAGTLVLLGLVLAHFFSAWWLALPAFAGANLLLSAVTGFCPGLVLFAKLAPGSARKVNSDALALSEPAVWVDVREPAEWAGGVAPGAALLPLSDLQGARAQWGPFLARLGPNRLLLYCKSGVRAGIASSLLQAEGYSAANVGGYAEWKKRGFPVRPNATTSSASAAANP